MEGILSWSTAILQKQPLGRCAAMDRNVSLGAGGCSIALLQQEIRKEDKGAVAFVGGVWKPSILHHGSSRS